MKLHNPLSSSCRARRLSSGEMSTSRMCSHAYNNRCTDIKVHWTEPAHVGCAFDSHEQIINPGRSTVVCDGQRVDGARHSHERAVECCRKRVRGEGGNKRSRRSRNGSARRTEGEEQPGQGVCKTNGRRPHEGEPGAG